MTRPGSDQASSGRARRGAGPRATPWAPVPWGRAAGGNPPCGGLGTARRRRLTGAPAAGGRRAARPARSPQALPRRRPPCVTRARRAPPLAGGAAGARRAMRAGPGRRCGARRGMAGPNGEPHVPPGGAGRSDDGDGDGDAFGEEEYAAINSMLDQINSCLDHLEEKNDYLHACLKELLESNRQTRLEFQQQSEQQNTEADVQGSQPPA